MPPKKESMVKRTVSQPQQIWDTIEELRKQSGRLDWSRQFEECLLAGIDVVKARRAEALKYENAQIKKDVRTLASAIAAKRPEDDPDIRALIDRLSDN